MSREESPLGVAEKKMVQDRVPNSTVPLAWFSGYL